MIVKIIGKGCVLKYLEYIFFVGMLVLFITIKERSKAWKFKSSFFFITIFQEIARQQQHDIKLFCWVVSTFGFLFFCQTFSKIFSGIFLVGGGGYACSGWGAGSGHFQYFAVIFGKRYYCKVSHFLKYFTLFLGGHWRRRYKDLCGHWLWRLCKLGLVGKRVDCKIGRTIWAMRATSIKKKASKIRVISK